MCYEEESSAWRILVPWPDDEPSTVRFIADWAASVPLALRLLRAELEEALA